MKKTFTAYEALEAIKARIEMNWNNQQLLKLETVTLSERNDIIKIILLTDDAPTDKDTIYELMGQYLSLDEDQEYKEVEEILRKELKENPYGGLDWVEGINVWEKVEGEFTVIEFCNLVGIKND